MSILEHKLAKILSQMEKDGFSVQERRSRRGVIYVLRGKNASVEITVEKKWISLDFVLVDSKISYSINSDVYDITAPEHKEFAAEIETDILDFLSNLKDGKIKIAYRKGRPLLLLLASDGPVLLKDGRFIASATHIRSLETIEKKYNFTPFIFTA